MKFPATPATAHHLSGLIEQTIARFTEELRFLRLPAALQFPQELEAVYEAETRQKRVRELRFTVLSASGFMCTATFTDPVLLPDIGYRGLELRLMGSAILVLTAYLIGKVTGPRREQILSVASFSVFAVIAGIPTLSRASTAPYGMFIAILGIIYANTTFPMRFQHAWPSNLLSLITMATYMHFDSIVSRGLAGSLLFMAVVATSYTLIANYRMEQSQRLGYLLASKEALRLFALNRDHKELAIMSSTDALTGLANRGQFDRRMTELFEGGLNQGRKIHLIMLDVDHFKRYNDRYGHPAGDACLRTVAATVKRVLRGNNDMAFRYGGEEFGGLLVDVPENQAKLIAERIRTSVEAEAVEHANREDGLDVITVSVGVATVTGGDGTTAESLIGMADRLLYAAKSGGRNRVCVSQTTNDIHHS